MRATRGKLLQKLRLDILHGLSHAVYQDNYCIEVLHSADGIGLSRLLEDVVR